MRELTYADYIHTPAGTHQRDLTPTMVYDAEYITRRYAAIDANVRALSARRLQVLEAFVPRGLLLDFGAGSFRFVEAAASREWPVLGWDIAPVDHHRRADCPFNRPGGWDVVTMFDVLEHLADPAETIRQLDANTLMISVPECHYPDDPEWFMSWKHRRPGEHLWHWNRETLPVMMDQLGYRLRMHSNFEDDLRPHHDQIHPNILTAIFTRT